MDLDAADRRILRHIQRSNRLTAAELGDLVGLSPPAGRAARSKSDRAADRHRRSARSAAASPCW